MTRSRWRVPRALRCAFAAMLLLAPSVAFGGVPLFRRVDETPLGPAPAVHAGFTVADVQAPDWGVLDSGYSISLRLEVEATPRLSPFVESTLGRLTGVVENGWYTYPSGVFVSHPDQVHQSFYSVGIGMRAYLLKRALFRPAAEAGVAARFAQVDESVSVESGSHGDMKVVYQDGPVGFGRFGVSMVQPRGTGLFADVGWEFVMRNPASRALYPIRVGILLPSLTPRD